MTTSQKLMTIFLKTKEMKKSASTAIALKVEVDLGFQSSGLG